MTDLTLSIVHTIARRYPRVGPLLSPNAQALVKAADSLNSINSAYHDAITEALTTYFEGGSVTAPRNAFKQAATEAFGAAFEAGWTDNGGTLPFDGDALEWFNNRLQEEFGHIDGLFTDAKELRKDKDYDWFAWVTARADAYTSALASIYNAAAMLVKKQMLTWRLGQTEVHCSDCKKLDGQRHRASWYIGKNFIPRQPGAGMECGGYNCDCQLENDDGEEVTI